MFSSVQSLSNGTVKVMIRDTNVADKPHETNICTSCNTVQHSMSEAWLGIGKSNEKVWVAVWIKPSISTGTHMEANGPRQASGPFTVTTGQGHFRL